MIAMLAAALTPAAQTITDVFFKLDYAILQWYHGLAEGAGGVLTPIADIISWTGWKGLFFIVMTVVLLFFRRTRKTAICCAIAMAIGYIAVNVLIKPAVARPRPYNFNADMAAWHAAVEELSFSLRESDLSFPSGHMNACCAFCASVVLTRGKKWFPWMLLYAVLMGMSRNYLQVHYPSDVLVAFFTGTIAAVLGWLITRAVYKKWGQSKLLRENRGLHEKA